jgi:hypothetical protein
MKYLDRIQKEQKLWAYENFKEQPSHHNIYGVLVNNKETGGQE